MNNAGKDSIIYHEFEAAANGEPKTAYFPSKFVGFEWPESESEPKLLELSLTVRVAAGLGEQFQGCTIGELEKRSSCPVQIM